MDSKIVFVALVLIASFALPSLAEAFEKDFITAEAVRGILKRASVNGDTMPSEETINALTGKTVISKVAFEEAFLNHGANGMIPCGETCVFQPCFSFNPCTCKSSVCYTNSLDM